MYVVRHILTLTKVSNVLQEHYKLFSKKMLVYFVGVLIILISLVLTMTILNPKSTTPTPLSAPDFEIEVFENKTHVRGETVKLSDYSGKPAVINFWFPSCPGCVIEFPHLEKTFRKFGEDVAFFGVMALFLDTVESGQQFIINHDVNFALGPDPQNRILADYQISVHPTTVFLDENHQIVLRWEGPISYGKLEELILELLN